MTQPGELAIEMDHIRQAGCDTLVLWLMPGRTKDGRKFTLYRAGFEACPSRVQR